MSQFQNITFHQHHGDDIQLFNNNTTARRVTPGEGLVFSSQPLNPYQKISLKLSEISEKTKEIVSVGFTRNHPSENIEPTYSLKIVSLKKHKKVRNKSFHFYYTRVGTIHFGIDGREKGCRNGKIKTNVPLWAFIHISNPGTTLDVVNYRPFNWSELLLTPLMMHQSVGRNVRIVKNEICKFDKKLNVSYAFSTHPLMIGEHVVVNIKNMYSKSRGNFVLGLTTCNPSDLPKKDLPEDVQLFLNRPEHWITVSDPTWSFDTNDRISFAITGDAKLKIWRNESTLLKEIPVDIYSNLWSFFDISNLEAVEVSSYVSPDLRKCEIPVLTEVKNELFSENEKEDSLCVVCYEKDAEAALYPCGHMCMCYGCAREQWRGVGQGCCPMCRVKIRDVLKIYKI